MTMTQKRTFTMSGLGVTLVGAVMLVVGYFTLDWYSIAGQGIGYSGFHDAAKLPGVPGWMDAYFTWLGMALLIAVIVVALAANIGIGPSTMLGPIGVLLGVAGTVGGIAALNQPAPHLSEVFKHTSAGLWLWWVGFLLTGIGAMAASWNKSS